MIDWLIVKILRLNALTMILLGAGVWMLSYQAWLGSSATHTEALVLGPEQLPAGATGKLNNPGTMLRVMVDGRRVECKDSATQWWWNHNQAGDQVPILLYMNSRYPECTVNTISGRWLLGALFLCGGWLILSILGKVWIRRVERPELH